ncbi:microfibril-associated protein [Reticulomyxa filosa]|uniref:Microfibril-associated protein n=1 Tax=Reticulomyxa filosa TaxID=46433 RepID=X6MA68_RETFI|nr:microfibril-associated protein [Reticulomyxa filosa]|eukprot:ETO09905.1 microfibril-associated protein [Reticulomyxa filosa]
MMQQITDKHVRQLSSHIIDHDPESGDEMNVNETKTTGNTRLVLPSIETNATLPIKPPPQDTLLSVIGQDDAHHQNSNDNTSPVFSNQKPFSDKLSHFLLERPLPEQLIHRNIVYTSPTDYEQYVEHVNDVTAQRKVEKEKKTNTLEQKLSWKFRARPEELLDRGIVTSPLVPAESLKVPNAQPATDAEWMKTQDKKRKSASLKQYLLHRPSPNEIIKQGIISATDVNEYVQPLLQQGTQEELDRSSDEEGDENDEDEDDEDDDDDDDEDDEDDDENINGHGNESEQEEIVLGTPRPRLLNKKKKKEDLMMIDSIQTKLKEWDNIQYELDNYNLELAEIETENGALNEELEELMFNLERLSNPNAQKKGRESKAMRREQKKEQKKEKYKKKILKLQEEVQRLQSDQIGFIQRTMDEFNSLRDIIKRLSK